MAVCLYPTHVSRGPGVPKFDFLFDVFPSCGFVFISARIGPTPPVCYLILYDERIDVVESKLSKAFFGEETKIKLKSSSASGFLRIV
ncbi:hypothetical protein V6N13_112361 [Hibiscus sabdariffa]|uniref:Uncharacterized protein n=1 Tax=Hibiscus sabdariffa TaxID=183260 RepID=A0ABR2TNB3_9ROSI